MNMYAFGSLGRSLSVRSLLTRSLRFASDSSDASRASHYPNKLEKYLLVWMKRYPSVKDVPNRVTPDEMEKVRNLARIRLNIFACIATVLGCIVMVKLGKDAVKRGESVKKMNIEWHKAQSEK